MLKKIDFAITDIVRTRASSGSTLALFIACLFIAACASTPTSGITDMEQMNESLHQLIPAGTPEADAIKTLKNEGFDYLNSPEEDAALDKKEALPPGTKVSVFSRNDHGSLIPSWIIGLWMVDGKVQNIRVLQARPSH